MSSHRIDLAWPDRLGRLRTAAVAADQLGAVLARLRVEPAELGWPGIPGPLTLVPDASGFPSPWDPDAEVRLCVLLGPDGEPSPACGRSALTRALADAAADGYDVVAAAELELFLLDADGAPVYDEIDNYGIVAGARYEHVLREVRALRHCGVPVVASNPEYGGGQFEINLRHGPALAAVDAVVLLRAWVAVAAARAGLRATFAAKPWPDGSGNGLHVHQSLWRDGANAFWDPEAEGLSAAGRGYLAGLLAAIGELTPLGSPSALAYTRRVDGSFCPTNVSWGGDNRTVAVRVLVETEPTTRIEQRDAAADANPYHVLAGQLTAGLDGIRRGLAPPPQVEGDAYARDDLPPLPRTLAEAVARFRGSALAERVLGAEAHAVLLARLEADAEAALAGHGTIADPDGGW